MPDKQARTDIIPMAQLKEMARKWNYLFNDPNNPKREILLGLTAICKTGNIHPFYRAAIGGNLGRIETDAALKIAYEKFPPIAAYGYIVLQSNEIFRDKPEDNFTVIQHKVEDGVVTTWIFEGPDNVIEALLDDIPNL